MDVMKSETGLSIRKPTPVLKKSIKVNFKDVSKALGKGLVDLSFGNWESLASNGVDALTALGLAANAGEMAWWLLYRSLLMAMKHLIAERPELDTKTLDFQVLQLNVNQALESRSVTINRKFFDHPDQDPIVEGVRPIFEDWLKQNGWHDAEARSISHRLPIYFVDALNEEWGRSATDYGVLKDQLDTPFTQANERNQAWLRYGVCLQKQVEEPMFMEAFSLKQVYVPLRAYYKRKLESDTTEWSTAAELDGRRGRDGESDRVVVDLEAELTAWLSRASKKDAIRLISGGPGSGKSSFAKMLAAKLASEDKTRVLLIPLHLFEASEDLIGAIDKFVRRGGILPNNPLDGEHLESRLLIMFDGLDELALQGKIAERTAKDFVSEVQRKVGLLNHQETRLQVLISGRELVVQANESNFRNEGQILHVLPYLVPEAEKSTYEDPQELLQEDQRQQWWKKYGVMSGKAYDGLPPELGHENLTEITAQPLLNYLVALSLQRGQLQFTENSNLNTVYADLIKAIYERGWAEHQHNALQGITEADFVRVLEEIALAAWHGNGRTTTVAEIERHCETSNLKRLLSRFQEGYQSDSKASITRLMTAFYFRQSGHDHSGDKTFEFTHKSFGEYLTARRIVQEVKYIHRKLADRHKDAYEDWDERRALHRWALLCGATAMDKYLFVFILDEMRLCHQQNPTDVIAWQQTLCQLINLMLKHGMPMERLNPRPDFQTENQQARHAEEALLVVLNSCAQLTKKASKIKEPDIGSFGILISRLQGQRLEPDIPLHFSCLSNLDLSGSILAYRDLIGADFMWSNLSHSNLRAAQLGFAHFYRATLIRTDLSSAILRHADLARANLESAKLLGANLMHAFLNSANLKKANLNIANLQWTNLQRANLQGADLEGANLFNANLRNASLERANLERANLNWANLEGANLENAILVGTNLNGANLAGADLRGTILEGGQS